MVSGMLFNLINGQRNTYKGIDGYKSMTKLINSLKLIEDHMFKDSRFDS